MVSLLFNGARVRISVGASIFRTTFEKHEEWIVLTLNVAFRPRSHFKDIRMEMPLAVKKDPYDKDI